MSCGLPGRDGFKAVTLSMISVNFPSNKIPFNSPQILCSFFVLIAMLGRGLPWKRLSSYWTLFVLNMQSTLVLSSSEQNAQYDSMTLYSKLHILADHWHASLPSLQFVSRLVLSDFGSLSKKEWFPIVFWLPTFYMPKNPKHPSSKEWTHLELLHLAPPANSSLEWSEEAVKIFGKMMERNRQFFMLSPSIRGCIDIWGSSSSSRANGSSTPRMPWSVLLRGPDVVGFGGPAWM